MNAPVELYLAPLGSVTGVGRGLTARIAPGQIARECRAAGVDPRSIYADLNPGRFERGLTRGDIEGMKIIKNDPRYYLKVACGGDGCECG